MQTVATVSAVLGVAISAALASPREEAIELVHAYYYRPERIPTDDVMRRPNLDLADVLRSIDGRLRLGRSPPDDEVVRAHMILGHLGIEIVEVADAAITITALPGSPGDRDGLAEGAVLQRIGAHRVQHLNDARKALASLGSDAVLQLEFIEPDWLAPHRLEFLAPPRGWFSGKVGEQAPAIAVSHRGPLLHARILRFEGGRTRATLAQALHVDPAPLLIDLRHSSGGSLKEALAIAAMFLPIGTEMGEMRPSTDGLGIIVANDAAPQTDRPVVIAVDRYTASAAEVLSAVLGQTGRAKIVGERSSGKCLAERAFRLSGGMTLEIPVSEFILPDSEQCNGVGVVPSLTLSEETLARSVSLRAVVVDALRDRTP
jgi:carboxyl-terminal processing protease